jgi:hypothetical protein
MRKLALTIAAILVMGSAFGQVWSYDWHGACAKVEYYKVEQRGASLYLYGATYANQTTIDLDPTSSTDFHSPVSRYFFSKMDTLGDYKWSFGLFGSNLIVSDYDVSQDGMIAISGEADSIYLDLDPSSNVVGFNGSQSHGFFIAFYDSSGNYLSHIEYDNLNFNIRDMAFDGASSLYFTGEFLGIADFDFTNATDLDTSNSDAIYITKMVPANGTYLWTKPLSKSQFPTYPRVIALESSGDEIFLGGHFTGDSLELERGNSPYFLQNNSITPSNTCSFISRMDTAGIFLNAISFVGHEYPAFMSDLSINSNGEIAAIFLCYGIDDSIIVNANNVISGLPITGDYIHVVAKFDSSSFFSWANVFGSNSGLELQKSSFEGDFIAVSGYFEDSLLLLSPLSNQFLHVSQPDMDPSILIAFDRNGGIVESVADRQISGFPGETAGAAYTDLTIQANGNLIAVVALGGNQGSGEFDVDPGPGIASTNATDTLNFLGNSYILRLNLDGFVATQNPHSPAQVLVYPNPTTKDLRVQSESPFYKVTLQDLQGRVLMSQTFDAVQSQTLDLSAISSGVYLLTIEGEMGRVTSKVVKQ